MIMITIKQQHHNAQAHRFAHDPGDSRHEADRRACEGRGRHRGHVGHSRWLERDYHHNDDDHNYHCDRQNHQVIHTRWLCKDKDQMKINGWPQCPHPENIEGDPLDGGHQNKYVRRLRGVHNAVADHHYLRTYQVK